MYRYSSYLRLPRSRLLSPRTSCRIAHDRGRGHRFSTQSEANVSKGSAEGAPKSWRQNPNLKYWVIGVSAITGIIYRYIYKEKEKKKLIVKNFPPLPNHKVQTRTADLQELEQLHGNLKTGSVNFVHLEGHTGSGKTLLARDFAEKLFSQNEKRFCFLPFNLFVGTVNAASLETLLFDMKRFAVAIGCKAKDWLDQVEEGHTFAGLSSDEQLHVIAEAVKEKLRANPHWILIVDGLKDENILEKLFDDEDKSAWGKGTVLITGCHQPRLFQVNSYSLEKGMDRGEASDLLQDLSGLPEDKIEGINTILNKLSYSPFAVACAGNYIKSRLDRDPEYSLNQFSEELNSGLVEFSKSNKSRDLAKEHKESAYVIASLLVKEYIKQSPHFLHTFDLIGSCSLDWPIPVTLVSLHLRSPEFHLAPVPRSQSVLPSLPEESNADQLQPKPEEDVQESFLSIKRLASNLESFMEAIKANYNAIKDAFYPPPVDTSPPADGVFDLMKSCSLLSVQRVNPGGVETLRVSPIVHEVMSQLFLSTTAPLLEENFLAQAEERHRNSSWFRRLWQFDPQRSLQEFRNSLGQSDEKQKFLDKKDAEIMEEDEMVVKERSNVPDLRFLLKEEGEDIQDLPAYRFIEPRVAAKHYQNHTSLVLNTIKGVSSVCSQDVQTRTLARLLKPHLDHILTSNTSKSLEPKSRAHALSAIAAINSALGNLDASIPSLERALKIEEEKFGESSLEVAVTLTRLAEVYSSLENPTKARELLERALGIYDLQRKKSGEYKKPLEFARTMEALGAVYGTLGFKQRSKEYIERSLSYMQASAPITEDEIERRRFACEVASTLTDLGHAYLSTGDAFSGRKLLELAVTGLKNMYGEDHPEVVRALTVLGTAYTMQGNWQEGKKMRREAGKLQAKIDGLVSL